MSNGILWAATYFGASRYDGRNWRNFLDKDSGLPSNFLNQVKTVDGTRTWFSTDKGLAYFDGESWATWRPALDTHAPEMLVRDAGGKVTRVAGGYSARPPLHFRHRLSRRRRLGGHRQRRQPRGSHQNGRTREMTITDALEQMGTITAVGEARDHRAARAQRGPRHTAVRSRGDCASI